MTTKQWLYMIPEDSRHLIVACSSKDPYRAEATRTFRQILAGFELEAAGFWKNVQPFGKTMLYFSICALIGLLAVRIREKKERMSSADEPTLQ